jgi:hypothetical protein
MANGAPHATERIRRLAGSLPVILISGLLFVVSQSILAWYFHRVGAGMALRLQTTLSSETFRAIVTGWQLTGKTALYLDHFYFDTFHPFWYSVFLSLLLARVFVANGVPRRYDFVLLLPFVAGALDLIENALHLWFLADLGRATAVPVALSGTASIVKWVLAAGGTVTVGVLALRWLLTRTHRQSADPVD